MYRVQHWLNDSGQEVTDEGKAVPQEVNLRRLILLIKPVILSIKCFEIHQHYTHEKKKILPNVFICIFSYFELQSMFSTSHHHAARSCAPSPDNPFSVKSCLILSSHLRFSLSFLLFTDTSITITLLP